MNLLVCCFLLLTILGRALPAEALAPVAIAKQASVPPANQSPDIALPAKLPSAPEPQRFEAQPTTAEQESAALTGSLPVQTVTLDDVVSMAERQSPRLKAAAAGTRQAEAATSTAHVYANPSLEVYEGEQYARPIVTPGVPGLLQHYAAYQPVEVPKERRDRVRTAELLTKASRYGEAGLHLSVVADAKHAFFNVLRRREEVAHTQENLQLVEDLRRRVEVEVQVGEKGRLELTRAEAELGRARYAVRGAQLELANGIALLRTAIAAPPDVVLNPTGTLDNRLSLPDLPTLRAQVLRTHPAVAQSETEIQAARANLEHEKALRIPQPTLFAEFENQPDLRFWRAGVTVPLPLWDRRRGRIEGANAAIVQNDALLNQRRLELISATERAYESYQLADQQAVSLESGELRAAESAVTAAQAAYRFGERGLVEVLDAQRVLQSVRDDLLDAQYARQSALIDLQELGAFAPTGRP